MTVCLIVFVILLFTGLPLFVNLGLSSFLYIFMTGDKPMVVVQRITQASNSFTMLAAPFFILMGNFMNTGGVTKKLFRFAKCEYHLFHAVCRYVRNGGCRCRRPR